MTSDERVYYKHRVFRVSRNSPLCSGVSQIRKSTPYFRLLLPGHRTSLGRECFTVEEEFFTPPLHFLLPFFSSLCK